MNNKIENQAKALRDMSFNDENHGIMIAILSDKINENQTMTSVILRGHSKTLTKALIDAMEEDSNFFELLRDAVTIKIMKEL